MDNINQINETYKNRLKKGLNLSLFYRTNTSLNKSLEIVKFSPKLYQNFNIQYNKKQKKSFNTKNKNNNNTTLFPSLLYKNSINQYLNKSMSEKNYFIPKKIDVSTQNNINIDSFILKIRKIPNLKLKSNFFKNLIEYIPQKNLNDIDYVIDSPFRGVEKIYSSSMSRSISNDRKKNNIYKSIYIHNNNKSCSSLKKKEKNKEIFDTGQRLENSKKDKYVEINKNKEIENPLEKISKLSGMSCYKLRQVIDYSLKNYLKIPSLNKNERSKNIKQFSNNNFNFNKTRHGNYNNLYSIITLKSTRKHKYNKINENLSKLYKESSNENIISSKKRNNI